MTKHQSREMLPSQLKEEYLQLVATWLLEEANATEDDLVRDTDTPYTIGTTRFGRQHERFRKEYVSRSHPWLQIVHGGKDLVFSIGGIPCRFSNDDAASPSKRAVVETHLYQMSLLEETEPGLPARFVFILDKGPLQSATPKVVLLGFSNSGTVVCTWSSSGIVRTLGEATPSHPQAVELPKPVVTPKKQRPDEDEFFADVGS